MDALCSIAENINSTLFQNILDVLRLMKSISILIIFIMLRTNIQTTEKSSSKSPKEKSSISPQARAFLDQVSRKKTRFLTSQDFKEEVPKKCGITSTSKVRVWVCQYENLNFKEILN
ncbi:CRB_1a_G0006010.mRNA.1.CDS.1 [Saccharomyces cerevisiae]|nr:CRB_1a_G0006010.mRNA.1.CDS.1 [Saccharomyces cerevisiae]CAI7170799.1 CRB_1a_G0006010.mRNA.1.CDS.1 [Saccharomyces cerevisiae]